MCDLMLSSPNDNEVICHISNLRTHYTCVENIGDSFFNIKIRYQNDHNDILRISIWPQWRDWICRFATKNLTVVRNGGLTALVIAFDMALTENEFGPKKIDRNDDLTALVI